MSGLPRDEKVGSKRFADFELAGKTFIVTGGARGLGLALAEALVEGRGQRIRAQVYCLDRSDKPDKEWQEALDRIVPEWGGSLTYCQQDVQDTQHLDQLITEIADENKQLNGVIAAAGIVQTTPALEAEAHDIASLFVINYTGVFVTATSAARAMAKYKCRGSICFIASMSGIMANKGMTSPVYNSSKAAVIQLARNLAMEWSPLKKDGTGGIRVNCISPGHIETPAVLDILNENKGLRDTWTAENMLGRLATTSEFKGAALFLISQASSFMTGSNLVIHGGHTAW